MAQEEKVGTLPSIIERLAQQVDSQDKELASLKQQLGLVGKERDGALREVEELTLDRDSLKQQGDALRKEWAEDVERIKRDSQRELADARADLVKSFDVERMDLRKEIMVLEQKAAGHADSLGDLRRDVEDWRNRYVTLSNESRQQTDACMAQLARIASILEERSASRRNASDPELQQSSPTVIPGVESSPASSPTAKKNPRLSDVKDPRTILSSSVNGLHPEPSKPTSTPGRRAARLENGNVSNGSESSGPSISQLGDAAYLPTPSQKRPRVQSQNDTTYLTNTPAIKSSSQQQQPGLPHDRKIITAHYEIKVEDDGNKDGSNKYFESDEEGDERLRKRRTIRQRSERIESSDDDERDVPSSQESEILDSEWRRDDVDEMAIGAEDNRQEVYGHRRVNVREVNTSARTPSRHRQPGKSRSMSSGKKRKAVLPVIVNGRPATAKKR